MFLAHDGWRNVWAVSELGSMSSRDSSTTPLRQILQPLNYSIPGNVKLFSSVNITCEMTSSLQYPATVTVSLQLLVYHQSVHLGTKLLETHNQRVFLQLSPCSHSPYVTSSVMRGWAVVLQETLWCISGKCICTFIVALSLNSVMIFSQDEMTDTLLSFKSASSSANYSLTFILIKTHEESEHLSVTT
jgi:hypothetical protein